MVARANDGDRMCDKWWLSFKHDTGWDGANGCVLDLGLIRVRIFTKWPFDADVKYLITLYGEFVAQIVGAQAGGLQVWDVALPWALGQR